MSRYFYDCEFLEDGRTIELISIGIVCDDGREYYAVNDNLPEEAIKAHPWLRANVWPFLPRTGDDEFDYDHEDVKDTVRMAGEIEAFLLADGLGPDRSARELWAWYGAYDHVALCQLWGRMLDLPDGVPMFTRDIKQEADRLGNPDMPDQVSSEHHALADARHNKVMFDFLAGLSS